MVVTGCTSALAVVAHPDDESFGLGAVLAALAGRGARVRVLCFTHGEASTLGPGGPAGPAGDLGQVRASELRRAAAPLGVDGVTLLDHPDGRLGDVPAPALDAAIEKSLDDADLLVVFEPGGVTGHPDHRAATAAAHRVAAGRGLPVLEWGVATKVADALNDELGTTFAGLDGIDLEVDRGPQLEAIACHHSQAWDNPVLRRRLELQGPTERLRLVTPGETDTTTS